MIDVELIFSFIFMLFKKVRKIVPFCREYRLWILVALFSRRTTGTLKEIVIVGISIVIIFMFLKDIKKVKRGYLPPLWKREEF